MNDSQKLFVDIRPTGICVYCAAKPDTRDHCPSKVLLDEPYPANFGGRAGVRGMQRLHFAKRTVLRALPEVRHVRDESYALCPEVGSRALMRSGGLKP